jgi:hypothetical protein
MTTANNQDSENILKLWLIAGISVTILLIISLGVYCCVPRSNPEQTQKDTERNQQVSGTTDDEGKDTGEEADRANQRTKTQISFEDYKHILQGYQDQEPADRSDELCYEEYALVDLVFLEKGENNNLKPFIKGADNRIGFVLRDRTNCERGTNTAWDTYGHHFRFRLKVYKKCAPPENKWCTGVKAGETYKITQFEHEEYINYAINIPPAEELTFQSSFGSFEGTKEDPIHRIPILVSDVMATQDLPEHKKPVNVVNRTLTIDDVPEPDHPAFESVRFDYTLNGRTYDHVEKTGSDSWTLNIQTTARDGITDLTGGTLAVYGNFYPEQGRPYLRLLGYVENVTSNPIPLTESDFVNYNRRNWETRTIKVGDMLRETVPGKMESWEPERVLREGLYMYLSQEHLRDKVMIFGGGMTHQDGEYYARIKAPPGTYHLTFQKESLMDQRFEWPPESK